MRGTRQILLVAATLVAIGATAARADARAEASPSERIAASLHGALDTIEAIEADASETAVALHAAWRWIDGLSAWQIRNGVGVGWLRDAASGADDLLDWVDPSGVLPRFGLQRYRIMTVRPVAGKQTSSFGYRRHPVLRRKKLHTGCDYRGDRTTPVHAAAPGVVVSARRWAGYGKIVIIDHGMGVETRYAHLSRMHVDEGDFVAAGARVGNVGRTGRVTGPHLHFEVRQDGRPVDPEESYLDGPIPERIREAVEAWIPSYLRPAL